MDRPAFYTSFIIHLAEKYNTATKILPVCIGAAGVKRTDPVHRIDPQKCDFC